MVGIVLGVLGLVHQHHALAQQRADARGVQLVGFDDLQSYLRVLANPATTSRCGGS